MDPGMVRRKVRSSPASAALRATCASSAAAPAVTRDPSTVIWLKPRPSRITTARNPPSRTIRLLPTPIGKTETSLSRVARKPARSSISAGWNNQSAGPPTRSQVRSDNDRFSVSLPRVSGICIASSHLNKAQQPASQIDDRPAQHAHPRSQHRQPPPWTVLIRHVAQKRTPDHHQKRGPSPVIVPAREHGQHIGKDWTQIAKDKRQVHHTPAPQLIASAARDPRSPSTGTAMGTRNGAWGSVLLTAISAPLTSTKTDKRMADVASARFAIGKSTAMPITNTPINDVARTGVPKRGCA